MQQELKPMKERSTAQCQELAQLALAREALAKSAAGGSPQSKILWAWGPGAQKP